MAALPGLEWLAPPRVAPILPGGQVKRHQQQRVPGRAQDLRRFDAQARVGVLARLVMRGPAAALGERLERPAVPEYQRQPHDARAGNYRGFQGGAHDLSTARSTISISNGTGYNRTKYLKKAVSANPKMGGLLGPALDRQRCDDHVLIDRENRLGRKGNGAMLALRCNEAPERFLRI